MRKLIIVALMFLATPVLGQVAVLHPEHSEPVATKIVRVKEETARINKRAIGLEMQLESLREEINNCGLNDGSRLVLEETRRSLPSVASSNERIAWIQHEGHWLKLQMLALEQSSEPGLVNTNSPVALGTEMQSAPTALQEMTEYSTELVRLTACHHLLVENVRAMELFLDRQLLWVANVHPLSIGDFQQVTTCAARLGNPGPWLELVRRCAARLNNDPWQLGVVVVLVIASGITAHRLGVESETGENRKLSE